MYTFPWAHHARKAGLVTAVVLALGACAGMQTTDTAPAGGGSDSKLCSANLERTPWFCRGGGQRADRGAGRGQWNAGQLANARAIVAEGHRRGVPRQAIVAALMAAMQESSLDVDACCDHDSVGLFQQRASWGTWSDRHDPARSAGKFYAKLLAISGWQGMHLNDAVQRVQVSATPDAYGKWYTAANALAG